MVDLSDNCKKIIENYLHKISHSLQEVSIDEREEIVRNIEEQIYEQLGDSSENHIREIIKGIDFPTSYDTTTIHTTGPLQHIPSLKESSAKKTFLKINAFLKQIPPRNIPKELYKSNRSLLAFFGLLLGCIFSIQFLLMGIYFSYNKSKIEWVSFTFLAISLVVTFLAFYCKRQKTKILKYGNVYAGKITKISSLPTRINGQAFYCVHIEFYEKDNCLVRCKETIDQRIVETFIDFKNNNQSIDVIYFPNSLKYGIIPLKTILLSRYS